MSYVCGGAGDLNSLRWREALCQAQAEETKLPGAEVATPRLSPPLPRGELITQFCVGAAKERC